MQVFNSKELQNCYSEETEIAKIIYGDKVIWENFMIIDLGLGQSFNIKNLYPDLYGSLSADNFFFTSASSASGSASVTVAYEGDTKYLTLNSGFYKSYNASTGILTMFMLVNNSHSNVHAYMVIKPSKLVYLGLGTSFNVKNSYPDKYSQFTADSFLIKTVKHFNSDSSQGIAYNGSRTQPGTWTGSDVCSISKSYNSSTGVLSVAMNDIGSTNIGENWNKNSSCYVYLNPRV